MLCALPNAPELCAYRLNPLFALFTPWIDFQGVFYCPFPFHICPISCRPMLSLIYALFKSMLFYGQIGAYLQHTFISHCNSIGSLLGI